MSNRDLHSLMYTSVAASEVDVDVIKEILQTGRRNNEQQKITGLLLYHEGTFLQVLEGDRKAISNLFEKKLMRDPRHTSVNLIHDEALSNRQFRYWHLAFSNLDDPMLQISQPYREFLNGERALFNLTNNPPKALDLVRQIHRRVLCKQRLELQRPWDAEISN